MPADEPPALIPPRAEERKKEEKKAGAVLPGVVGETPAAFPRWFPGPLKDLLAGLDSVLGGAGTWKATLVKGVLVGAVLAGLVQAVITLDPFSGGSAKRARRGSGPFDKRPGADGRALPANEGLLAKIPGIYERIFGPKLDEPEPEPAAAGGAPSDSPAAAIVPAIPDLSGLGGGAGDGSAGSARGRLERLPGFAERSGSSASGGGGGPAAQAGSANAGGADGGAAGSAGRSSLGAGERAGGGGKKARRVNARMPAGGTQGLTANSAREQLQIARKLTGEARFGAHEAAAGSISAAFDGKGIGGPGASAGAGGVGSMGKESGVGGGGMGSGALEPEDAGGGSPLGGGGGGGGGSGSGDLKDKNVTPWQKDVTKAKTLIREADGLKSSGKMYIIAGFALMAVAWKTPAPMNMAVFTAAMGLVTKGFADYRSGNQKLEEVQQIADGLLERYGQKDQARILQNGIVTAGSGLPMKDPASCGYTPDMGSRELDEFMRCMAAAASSASTAK